MGEGLLLKILSKILLPFSQGWEKGLGDEGKLPKIATISGAEQIG